MDDGQARACITLYESGRSPVGDFALQELRSYLEKITGVYLQARTLALPDKWRLASSVIVTLAPCGHEPVSLPMRRLIAALSKDPPDSFLLKSTTDSVIMVGNDARGTLYAVYAALEAVGVRFLAPAYGFYHGYNEIVPHARSLVFPETSCVQQPAFRFRKIYVDGSFTQNPENLPALLDWMAKNRLNVLAASAKRQYPSTSSWGDYVRDPRIMRAMRRRGIIAEVGGHGYDVFIPFAKYPPFYELRDSFPCFSRAGVLQTYIRNVIRYLKNHPEIRIFDAWPPDGRHWCAQDLKKWGTPEEIQAQVIVSLDTAVHRSVPGVTVEMLSYAAAQNLPITQLPANIMVDFAAYNRSYTHNLFDSSDQKNRQFAAILRAWADRAHFKGALCYYSYYRKYSWDSRPVILTHLIAAEAGEFRHLGLSGLGSYSEPADWVTYEFTHYLVAQVSWNPSLDVDRFLSDYLDARYGRAANGMRVYFNSVEKAGQILFDSPGGAFEQKSPERLLRMNAALEDYGKAQQALQNALITAGTDRDAGYFIKRLNWNLEFTLLDLHARIAAAYHEMQQAATLERRARELVYLHRDDGIFLYPLYSVRMDEYRNTDKRSSFDEPWKARSAEAKSLR